VEQFPRPKKKTTWSKENKHLDETHSVWSKQKQILFRRLKINIQTAEGGSLAVWLDAMCFQIE
jgi:hypothetical protein